MDVLDFLKNIRGERFELERVKETRRDLYYSLMPSGISYDGDKVQSSPSDKLSEGMAEIAELDSQLAQKQKCLTQHIIYANSLVDRIPAPECRELLGLRYLDITGDRSPMSWQEIADCMGYSVDYVRGKLHGKAIRLAREIWKREHTGTH